MVATLLVALHVGVAATAGMVVIGDANVLGATGSTPNAPPGSLTNVLVLQVSGDAVIVPVHAPYAPTVLVPASIAVTSIEEFEYTGPSTLNVLFLVMETPAPDG